MKPDRIRGAAALMNEFAARTRISMPERSSTRYLWTDAFAVFNFLALNELTGRKQYLDRALRLVDRVHHTLGRHRDDDPRTGWISGLSESGGERHPTCGGLRIGKELNERSRDEPRDDQLEWDRDGQYFHYLTKWMHALTRVSLAAGASMYNDWALELAEAAHRAFTHQLSPDGRRGLYWKMSIDLSRPLVPSMGQFDPLDGLVTYSRLQATRSSGGQRQHPDIDRAQSDLLRMCEGGTWTTGDELGLGGLLTDAHQMIGLIADGHLDHLTLLDDILVDVHHGLRHFAAHNHLKHPAETRLAFRELGLSIGLQSLHPMHECVQRHSGRFRNSEDLLARIDSLACSSPLIKIIERFWLEPGNRKSPAWTAHRDINSVMLATSLVPHVYLMDDPHMFDGHRSPQVAWSHEQEPQS